MIIRFIVYFILLITCYVLQGTLFAGLNLGGVVPNLLLVFTASFGLMRGRRTGLLLGFFCGLLMDIFSGSSLGFYSCLLMYLGYYAGSFHRIFFAEDVKLPLLIVLSADLLYGFFNYVFIFLLQGRTNIGHYFVNIVLPECAYTILVTLILYPLFLSVNRVMERRERKQAKKFV